MSDRENGSKERVIDPRIVRIVRVILISIPILMIVVPEGLGRMYIYANWGVPGKSLGMWQTDPELGGMPKPNSYSRSSVISAEGFRNREDVFTPKPAGSRRVITYGGSTTFCYNVTNDEAWPLQLQEFMRGQPGHEQDQVLNGGVINWSLGHALIRAKRDIPKFKPDYVLVYSGFNEWKNADHLDFAGVRIKDLVAGHEYGVVATTFSQSSWLMQNSLIYRFYTYYVEPSLFQLFAPSRMSNERKDDFVEANHQYIVDNYINVLREMNELVRDNGGELVFVTQTALTPDVERFADWLVPSRAGAGPARAMGVRVLTADDMVNAYEGERSDLFYTSGIHFSKVGNRELGRFLIKNLFDDQPIGTGDPSRSH